MGMDIALAGRMTSDLLFTIGLASGWMALVVALAWPTPHCRCCTAQSVKAERPDRIRR